MFQKRAWAAVLGGIIVLVSGFPAPSLADTVELTTGQRIDGTLKQATQQTVVIDVRFDTGVPPTQPSVPPERAPLPPSS
jgi:hypothetical protein